MTKPPPAAEQFLPRLFDVTAPLLIWAVHFFASYIISASACLPELNGVAATPAPIVGVALAGWTFVMGTANVALLLRAVRRYHGTQDTLMHACQLGCAGLGTIGIAWTMLPLFVVSLCRI